jgi:hypothetical protein
MPSDGFLHNHPDFSALMRIVAQERSIDPILVEKDYWIMHCLFGLQRIGMVFELKGGTSLSKGFGLIYRFSEDIDIRIEPPSAMGVKTGRNQDKPEHCESRKKFYNWLAKTIKIDGISDIQRDTAFDDGKYRSGGVRLYYKNLGGQLVGLKDGILLEVGFDDITPNIPQTISSWAYDYAVDKVPIVDNRALNVACYHPGYTLVEKLQTLSTKYRQQQQTKAMPINFMRHYYDVYCLLQDRETLKFIGTPQYNFHKNRRFRSRDNPVIAENEAFLLRDAETRAAYKAAYQSTRALYYQSQPDFDEVLAEITKHISDL